MKLAIDIPAKIEESLSKQFGGKLVQAAKEALAVAWYREERLSIGQVAEFLGISIGEADGLMKRNRVEFADEIEQFESGRESLDRLLKS